MDLAFQMYLIRYNACMATVNEEAKSSPGDLSSGIPRHVAVHRDLRDRILTGRITEAERIPPEMELCSLYGVSRRTVRRAIAKLVDEGLVERQRARGTFVKYHRSAGQHKLIGMMFPRRELGGAFVEVFDGAARQAEEEGYQLVVVDTVHDGQRMLERVGRLNASKPVGTILTPILGTSDEPAACVVDALTAAGQKVVLVNSGLEGRYEGKLSWVGSRNFEGGHELTRRLISMGYTRIAYLRGPRSHSQQARIDGFTRAMEEAGLPIRPEYMLQVGSDDIREQGVQEVNVFRAMVEPPEAILCVHDLIAVNVIRRCREVGIRVPADVAVAGFDDLPVARACHPPLTTVRQPLREIGRRAMEILIGHIHGRIAKPVIEQLPCKVVVRESCSSDERRRDAGNGDPVMPNERNQEGGAG
jgi:DNA-binding LacI/PurR family transcriptional regulator